MLISFSSLEITSLMLASLVLISQLIGVIIRYNLRSNAPSSGLELLLRQPYMLAGAIILSFALKNDIGIVSVNLKALLVDEGLTKFVYHTIDLLRFALVMVLIYQEERLFYAWLEKARHVPDKARIIFFTVKNSLRVLVFALLIPFLLPNFEFFPGIEHSVKIMVSLLIIWSIIWLLTESLDALDAIYTVNQAELNLDDYQTRSNVTKTKIFKKIAAFILVVIGIALSCLIFESARTVGASILASAGIVTGVLGFAANKIIGNFLVGLQIAVTQPIKINDAISVEGEFGVVEEISLNYVVVKIWDLRRLILPINYFIEKPFLNLSRNSTDIICQIYFYADYTLPVAKLREVFHKVVAESEYWDKNTVNLQVADVQDKIIKLRGIASTKNPSDSWNLKCDVLEKLTAYIATNYPDSLPKLRFENHQPANLNPAC